MNSIIPFVLLLIASVSQSIEKSLKFHKSLAGTDSKNNNNSGEKIYRCDYTYFEEAGGYLKFQEIPASFIEARLRCHLEGAKLASPVNAGLRSAISKLSKKNGVTCAIRTGIHATFSRGDFFSVEGVHLSDITHEWAEDEPNNIQDSQNCVIQLTDGKLAVISCDEPFPYLCYKKGGDMVLNSCGTTDNDYYLDNRTGSCYKFHTLPRTWSRAYMTCAAEGGYLAIINSITEATVIKELFAKYPNNVIKGANFTNIANIGFHDWGEIGEWLTIEGDSIKNAGFDTWDKDQPNNATTGQFCGSVYRSANLNDMWCESLLPFICEKDPQALKKPKAVLSRLGFD